MHATQVLTKVGSIPLDDWHSYVGKYVRRNHVQADEHWMSRPIQPNGVADGNHT